MDAFVPAVVNRLLFCVSAYSICCSSVIDNRLSTSACSRPSSTVSRMLALYRAHAGFLAAVKGTQAESAFQAIAKDHCKQICDGLRRIGQQGAFDLVEGATLAKELSTSPFDASSVEEITSTLSAMAASTGPLAASLAPTRRAPLRQQEHLYMHKYLTATEWESLMSPDLRVEAKIDVVVARCGALGLLSVTEPTAKACVCLVIMTHGEKCDHQGAYGHLQTFKRRIKIMQTRLPRPASMVMRYPSDVAAFVKDHPDAYTTVAPPVPSKVDEAKLRNLIDGAPARRTHDSLRASPLANAAPGSQGSVPPMQMHAALLPQLLQQLHRSLAAAPQPVQLVGESLNLTDLVSQLPANGSPARPFLGSPSSGLQEDSQQSGAPAPPSAPVLLQLHDTAPPDQPHHANAASPMPRSMDAVAQAVSDALEKKALDKKKSAGLGKVQTKAKDAKAKAKGQAPAKAKGQAPAKAKGQATRKGNAKAKSALVLGCCKCRGAAIGCAQCRSDKFGGKRGPR